MSMRKVENQFWEAIDRVIEGHYVKVKGMEIHFRSKDGPTPAERAETDSVLEYWVQQYVRHNYQHIGFERIEGPFDVGPDFRAVPKGGNAPVAVEVEVRCENYIKHGHHQQPRFADVAILIVLEQQKPPAKLHKLLPKQIIHIDKSHFTPWYEQAARAYAQEMEQVDPVRRDEARLAIIAGDLHSRWVKVCPHRDRDMATCPDCELCPYFGNADRDANEVFAELALDFVASRKTEKLNLGTIAPSELDAFFRKRVGLD